MIFDWRGFAVDGLQLRENVNIAMFVLLLLLAAVAMWNVETLPPRNVVSATQTPKRDVKLQREWQLISFFWGGGGGFQHMEMWRNRYVV